MKLTIILFFNLVSLILFGQATLPMSNVTQRQELSMADVDGKNTDGLYRYYAKGATSPYTGVLYAIYPNGQLLSWQEYVEGVGQGKWINYYENGNKKEIGHYVQNRVEGAIQKFFANGQLQAEGMYKDWRIMVGTWSYYDEKGQLVNTIDYGTKGSIDEVQAYYDRGDISYSWYSRILANNGF